MEDFTRRTPLTKALAMLVVVLGGTAFMVGGVFLLLPLIQQMGDKPIEKKEAVEADVFEETPPAVVDEPDPPEKVEDEEPPPELEIEPEPVTFESLQSMLGDGSGGGGGSRAFVPNLSSIASKAGAADFEFKDLDQRPRPIYQAQPTVGKALAKQAPATVWVAFLVDAKGRVQRPRVQSSSNPAFERAAVAAVKKWKFEPGKRGGKPSEFRMKIPITFPRRG